jgi:hypothetical protein
MENKCWQEGRNLLEVDPVGGLRVGGVVDHLRGLQRGLKVGKRGQVTLVHLKR